MPTPLERESPADSSCRSAVETYRTRVRIIRASTWEAPSVSAVWTETSSGRTKSGLSHLRESSVMLRHPTCRVVRLSKRGAIVAQYVSPAFDDLRAYAVNVESDQLVVVSGTKVFQVPLTTP